MKRRKSRKTYTHVIKRRFVHILKLTSQGVHNQAKSVKKEKTVRTKYK